jgi:uncharacterized protein
MTRVRTLVAAVCLAAGIATSVFLLPVLSAQAPAGVVISEFRVRGPNGGSDEFVEVFNNSTAAIDISGWKIKGSNSTGTVGVRVTVASNTALKAGCYFLATNSSTLGGPYSASVAGDQTYLTGITDDGGVAITKADDTIVDQVGLSARSAFKEGSFLPSLGSSNLNRGFERRAGTTATYLDGGNNSADFAVRSPSNPQSRAQCSADPSGVGSAVPGALDPGASVQLTVRVTPGTFPASTDLAVTADLTSIGGLNPQPLYDDGTSGDVAAGDHTFSLATTVAIDTSAGSKTIPATITDGQGRSGAATIRVDIQQPLLAIHAIQGAGLTSTHSGDLVSTRGVVAALRGNGFFIQTPDADVDADDQTSEGIFVFTSTAPGASVRQYVQVTGRVQEFRPGGAGTPPITEISGGPSIAVIGSGYALPSPAELLPAFTTPDGGLEQLERFEGMRVTGNLEVVSPTAAFALSTTQERNADPGTSRGEFYVVIRGVPRPFREPGLEPGQALPAGTTACCVPRFDGNPERLRVLSDGQAGAAKLDVAGGQVLNGFTGVMDYGFNSWTILPDPGATVAAAAARPVPAPSEGEFTIGSFNMERFFDTVNDPDVDDVQLTAAAFQRRLSKASLAIRYVLGMPDILGAVEIENLGTLQAIADRVNADALGAAGLNPGYVAYLEEGNDIGGIDVGFLVKSARVNVITVTQVGKDATYTQPDGNQNLLNDRPPLVLEVGVVGPLGDTYPVTVIVNHLRSLSGIDDAADGGRVRAKRRAQAEFLANYIQGRQAAQPGERIVSVGDYNAFQFSDGYVDSIGTIKGAPTDADRVVLASTDLVNPDLTNLVELAPVSERYSFVFAGNPQLLDHVLASHSMQKRFSRLAFGRGNADFPEAFRAFADRPERLSDHDAPVAYFAFPSAPLVTMNGAAEMRVEAFTGTYTEPGATAADSDGSWPVTVDGSVDVSHPGDYSIAYTATNGYLTTTVHRVVHVIDSVKPEIGGFSLTPATLGPPNHKLVDVTALYEISDASGRATCSLAAVSNEPADGSGDGHTASDIVVIDARRLKLRAERSGHGGGRTYTATLRCSDSSGNISTASAVARVLK